MSYDRTFKQTEITTLYETISKRETFLSYLLIDKTKITLIKTQSPGENLNPSGRLIIRLVTREGRRTPALIWV